ncbi:hypothetical protein [Bacteroides heparinolyticus]|uniref:hypothetical protein n=3 Tax=Prevotella heparinolytica TaxID=28113 RepID=UPI0035A1AD03
MVTLFLMAHYICRKNKKKNRFFGVCIGEKTLKAAIKTSLLRKLHPVLLWLGVKSKSKKLILSSTDFALAWKVVSPFYRSRFQVEPFFFSGRW